MKAWQTPGLTGVFTGFQINVPQLVRRRRPREGEAAGRRSRRLRDDADLPGLALRQRLQPLRPHLPGHCAGRRAVPLHRRTSRSSRCATPRARWCRSAPSWTCETSGPGSRPPLQRLSRRRYQRRAGARLQLRRGRGDHGEARRERAAERHRLRVDRAHLSGDPRRQHGLFIFPLCVLLVFLVLAAQYESWSLPLAIILIVPMCCSARSSACGSPGGDNNIFTQIGLVVLVGLACKNAILIVEFAQAAREQGR